MKKQYLKFTDYVNEARNEEIFDYPPEKKSKGVITHVKALEKAKEDLPPMYKEKLDEWDETVRLLHKSKLKLTEWKSKEEQAKGKLLDMIDEFTDENDVLAARVIETVNTVVTITKKSEGTEKTKLKWDDAFEYLIEAMEDFGLAAEQIDKMVDKAKERGTEKYTTKGSEPYVHHGMKLKHKYGNLRADKHATDEETPEEEAVEESQKINEGLIDSISGWISKFFDFVKGLRESGERNLETAKNMLGVK